MECPCCFQELPEIKRGRVSLDHNLFIHGGIGYQLSPQEAELLYILAEKSPEFVSSERIMARIYGAGEQPETGITHIIGVLASKIRAKLKEYDAPIVLENGLFAGVGGMKYRIRYL